MIPCHNTDWSTYMRAIALMQENGLANAPLIEKSRILNDRYEKEALKHSKKAGLTQQAPFLA